MIVHNVEEGKYTEDKAALDELQGVRALKESVEKHKAVVQVATDDYRSWNVLKRHLLANPGDFKAQLRVCERALRSNPKSYQAWHHRRFMMNRFPQQRAASIAREDMLTRLLLEHDPRNFHCWNYRMLLPRTGGGRDLFNYSYLHHHLGSEDPVPIIYTDPTDPTGWEHFYSWREARRMRHGMYARKYKGCLEIRLARPFCGEVAVEGGGASRVVFLDIDTRTIAVEEMAEAAGKYSVTMAGAKVDLVPETEAFGFVDEIIRIEPESVGALIVHLDYMEEEAERAKAIERASAIDPVRKSYYSTLQEAFYRVYVPEATEQSLRE